MATTQKPSPPKPPQLPSKEEVAAHLAPPKTQDDEEAEGTTIDQIRAHLSEADDLLDQLEADQG
jgi:hypothetical protein